jgi:hypothetical protein
LKRNEKDLTWYRGCFEGEAKAYGEVAPNYTKHPGFPSVPKRMNDLLPNVKLIYLVRDPIERAISHYVHNWAKRRVAEPIDQAFHPVEESGYLNTSRYHFQLTQYLEYWSMEDILVIQSERLQTYSDEVMEEIFRYIGVDPDVAYEEERFTEQHHVSSEKARKNSIALFLTESALGRAVKDAIKPLVPQKTIEWAKNTLRTDVEKPTLREDLRVRAQHYLQEDIDQLRELTGKEFRGWSV